jgi:FixJ family two-component response regulator
LEKTQTVTPKVPNRPKEKDKLGKTARRRQVMELKAQGKIITDIAKQLDVSEKTVDRDLKSQDYQKFIDELVRRQIVDIEASKPLIRLNYRSDLLDKLLPKKMEQKIEGGESWKVEIVDNSKNSEDTSASTTT